MRLFEINENYVINLDQVCSIARSVKGSKCGASFDEKDCLFTVINMSDRTSIRAKKDGELADRIAKELLGDR